MGKYEINHTIHHRFQFRKEFVKLWCNIPVGKSQLFLNDLFKFAELRGLLVACDQLQIQLGMQNLQGIPGTPKL